MLNVTPVLVEKAKVIPVLSLTMCKATTIVNAFSQVVSVNNPTWKEEVKLAKE